MGEIKDRFSLPLKEGCASVDGRASGLQSRLGIQQRIGKEGRGEVQTRALVIRAIVPVQVVGGNGIAIHLLCGQRTRIDEQVIQCNQIVAPGQPIIVADKGVVVDVNTLRNAGRPKVFDGIPIVHQPQPDHGVVPNKVALDENETVRQVGIVDELNAIFVIAGNCVVADDDVQHRTGIRMKPDLDPVVAVVADDVVCDDHLSSPVQIDSIIAIVLEKVVPAEAATTFVVDRIAISNEPVMENLKRASGRDAIATILNRESVYLGFGANRGVHCNSHAAVAIDDGLIDYAGILDTLELGGHGDGLARLSVCVD